MSQITKISERATRKPDTVDEALLLTIVTYPDPALTKKAEPVEKITDEIRELAKQMIATMQNTPTGVGLAAPQVGVSLRLTVVDPAFDPEEGLGEEPFAMVNPEIVESEGSFIEDEGCLSLPGLTYDVERPEKITLSYTDIEGNQQKIVATEYLAKLFCHEIDHLDGILLWDRVSRFKRDWLKAKYKKSLKARE